MSITRLPLRLPAAVCFLILLPGPLPALPQGHTHRHQGVPERFSEHPAVGEMAPDFTLQSLEGRGTSLGEYLGRGYLILVFGSATCSEFRQTAPGLNRLAGDWERLEVKVLVTYTREAHPATLRTPVPRNYQERMALARETRSDLKLGLPVLVDEWDDRVHRAYGSMPNAAFLIDSKGIIVARQAWVNLAGLEKELTRRLDPPEPPAQR